MHLTTNGYWTAWGGAHMGYPEHSDAILIVTELLDPQFTSSTHVSTFQIFYIGSNG